MNPGLNSDFFLVASPPICSTARLCQGFKVFIPRFFEIVCIKTKTPYPDGKGIVWEGVVYQP